MQNNNNAEQDSLDSTLWIHEYPSPLAQTPMNQVNKKNLLDNNKYLFINRSAAIETVTAATATDSSSKSLPTYKNITETDKGHRHFSSMHWLYPNTFLPNMGYLHVLLFA